MLKKIIQFLRRYTVLLKFYGYFLYFLALLYFLSHWNVTENILGHHLPVLIATIVGKVFNAVGMAVSVSGATINVKGFAYRIIYHCTGVFLMAIYTSAVLAYPATWKERIVGLFFGNPLLFLSNVLRLVMLGYVGYRFPQYFDASHEVLWQGIFIVFVVFLWLIWKEKFVKSEKNIPLSP